MDDLAEYDGEIRPGRPKAADIARQLAELYERDFGGKERGRFRISMKLMKSLCERRRISTSFRREITEELYELGYIMVDMEIYFAVLGQGTLSNYRRVSEQVLDKQSVPTVRH